MGIGKQNLEDHFLFQIKALGVPEPIREHRFMAPTRQFRFDFAWPDQKIAVEVEGGTFSKGKSRHTTGSGFHNDAIKYNYAVLYGWRVLRGDVKMVESGELVNALERVMRGE
jgi:very-short-patch-repair endonuclease